MNVENQNTHKGNDRQVNNKQQNQNTNGDRQQNQHGDGGNGPQHNTKSFHNRNNKHGKPGGKHNKNNHHFRKKNYNPRNKHNNNGRPQYLSASSKNWANEYKYKILKGDESSSSAKLKVYTVSGVEMVGTNCTVIEYEDDIMIIDVGLGYPDEFLPGVDLLVPNLEYFYQKKDKVRGIVITHGHTDHIGGIQHVIEKLGFPPIYGPKLALELIKLKLQEYGYVNKVQLFPIDGNSSYYLGKFNVNHFKMTHTIPDNYGLSIDTPIGRVVVSSDYKFDSSPYKEAPSDYSKLGKLGDQGVLLLLNESTNAKREGWSESESKIANDIDDIIRESQGRVIIGMFSTMVNRMRQIVELSAKYNKKVAVLGRSLENIVKITHNMGLINVSNGIYIDLETAGRLPEDQVVIIATGSQGEANAALMRIAEDRHNKVQFKPNDTVVFSSSKIPGNEDKIDRLIDLISKKEIRVLTNDNLTLHATGHGHKEDHKLMLQLTKPKFIMPVHGDYTMRNALIDTAKELGYRREDCITVFDGACIEIDANSHKVFGTIESNPLWVEGNRVGNFNKKIIEDRKKLVDEGIIIIGVRHREDGEFNNNDVDIVSKGFFIQEGDNFFNDKLKNELLNYVSNQHDRRPEELKKNIVQFVENEIYKQYEKNALVAVIII